MCNLSMNFQAGDLGRDTGVVYVGDNAVGVAVGGLEGLGEVANVELLVKGEGGYLLALQRTDQLNVQ